MERYPEEKGRWKWNHGFRVNHGLKEKQGAQGGGCSFIRSDQMKERIRRNPPEL